MPIRELGLRSYLIEKRWELLIGSFTSAIGLLVALLINSSVEHRKDTEVYDSMLRGIRVEAASNRIVLRESFLKYYESGLVLRSFDYSATTRTISDPLFVRNAEPQTLQSLEEYLRAIRLANAYREQLVAFRVSGGQPEVLAIIVAYLKQNLKDCSRAISKVEALK